MTFITVAVVFVKHSSRTEPYLQSKIRRVQYAERSTGNALSLNYRAFGPESAASEIIGKQHWQWKAGPEGAAPESFDIKVIVYRDATVAELTEDFPLIETKRMDPRYLEYDDAIAYLDKQISVNAHPEVTTTLKATRAKLQSHFGP